MSIVDGLRCTIFLNRARGLWCRRILRCWWSVLANVLGTGSLFTTPGDANRIISFMNLNLFDVRLFDEFDQFLDFANIHSQSNPVVSGLSVNSLHGGLKGEFVPLAA